MYNAWVEESFGKKGDNAMIRVPYMFDPAPIKAHTHVVCLDDFRLMDAARKLAIVCV